MLEGLLGTINREKVLLFIWARAEGYPREVARFFSTDLRAIQNQFEKLEVGGVLSSRKVGNTRLYTLEPRYPFLAELNALLKKVYTFYPENEQEKLMLTRRRPRRSGKPL